MITHWSSLLLIMGEQLLYTTLLINLLTVVELVLPGLLSGVMPC